MPNWLARLFKTSPIAESNEQLLALQNENQRLRLDLQESLHTQERLAADQERQRAASESNLAAHSRAQMETFLEQIAAPISQLSTQIFLAEEQSLPIQARDVLAVVKRLVNTLQANGIMLDGKIGAQVAYDPECHELLSAGSPPQPGQPVIIRFAGLSYNGRLLRKAGVAVLHMQE